MDEERHSSRGASSPDVMTLAGVGLGVGVFCLTVILCVQQHRRKARAQELADAVAAASPLPAALAVDLEAGTAAPPPLVVIASRLRGENITPTDSGGTSPEDSARPAAAAVTPAAVTIVAREPSRDAARNLQPATRRPESARDKNSKLDVDRTHAKPLEAGAAVCDKAVMPSTKHPKPHQKPKRSKSADDRAAIAATKVAASVKAKIAAAAASPTRKARERSPPPQEQLPPQQQKPQQQQQQPPHSTRQPLADVQQKQKEQHEQQRAECESSIDGGDGSSALRRHTQPRRQPTSSFLKGETIAQVGVSEMPAPIRQRIDQMKREMRRSHEETARTQTARSR